MARWHVKLYGPEREEDDEKEEDGEMVKLYQPTKKKKMARWHVELYGPEREEDDEVERWEDEDRPK